MPNEVMMIITSKKQHQAFLAGQAGRTSNEIADQLIEQLSAARAELQQARAEHAAKIAAARALFDSEAEAMRQEAEVMRREFNEAMTQLNELRLRMFHQWTRTDEMLN
jgi:uncharacterized protein YllA (UPF0747 family)